MKVITLTTDWGLRDYYVASLKGQLLSLCPGATLVDITHEVSHFDILQASFIVSNCFDKFPEGTIHLIAIRGNRLKEKSNGYVLIKCRKHYFIGFDSGIFNLILGDEEKEIYILDISVSQPIHKSSMQLCEIISRLQRGNLPSSLGVPTDDILKIYHTQPSVDNLGIRGSIIHIDSFHNVTCNITRELFEQVGRNRPFRLTVRNHDYELKHPHQNYEEAEESELVFLFNEKGNLVLALNRSKAATLLGLKLFETIRIEFEDR